MALDAVAYLAVYRTATSLLAHEQQQFAAARLECKAHKAALVRVRRRAEALPASERQVRSFVLKHVPNRREGYSRAGVLIEGLTQRSNVELAGIGFKREDREDPGPFKRLTMNIYVQGSFANLLNFGHDLETASDFIVVRGFKFESAAQGVLGLRLTADLYLMP